MTPRQHTLKSGATWPVSPARTEGRALQLSVITPSAARAFRRHLLAEFMASCGSTCWVSRYIALRRNEVKERAPGADTILQWAGGKSEPQPILADADKERTGTDTKGRTQRQTMALKNVRYRLHAAIRPWPQYHAELPSMEAQFVRRARAGQCIYQPYLGCREFPAFFRLCEGEETRAPISLDLRIGWMLYEVFDPSRPGTSSSPASISLFEAEIKGGVLTVPAYEDKAVHRPQGGPGHD